MNYIEKFGGDLPATEHVGLIFLAQNDAEAPSLCARTGGSIHEQAELAATGGVLNGAGRDTGNEHIEKPFDRESEDFIEAEGLFAPEHVGARVDWFQRGFGDFAERGASEELQLSGDAICEVRGESVAIQNLGEVVNGFNDAAWRGGERKRELAQDEKDAEDLKLLGRVDVLFFLNFEAYDPAEYTEHEETEVSGLRAFDAPIIVKIGRDGDMANAVRDKSNGLGHAVKLGDGRY